LVSTFPRSCVRPRIDFHPSERKTIMQRPRNLRELRDSGHRPTRVKDEIRRNLIRKMRSGEPILPNLIGYHDTVIPEVVHALLARHDILLLGTRGQGKSLLLRHLVEFLDDSIPIVAGSEVRDDPFAPISEHARRRLAEEGENTPIEWIGRQDRYQEKLATPDVTMADLFGDIDLLKHVQGRSLADEGSLHFGLVPRANRGIFCINELPDLSPKIQVGLFNLLQERDVQIRGFPVRFNLDLCVVFSANPEDYTSRGRIVTPLKDRIGSVVRTHYPRSRQEGVAVTDGSTRDQREGGAAVCVPLFMKEIIEEVAHQARQSPAINQQSGVSARLAIAGRELIVSSAERRALLLNEPVAVPRIDDLTALAAAARGKIEVLLPEEDSEERLVSQFTTEAIRVVFEGHVDREQEKAALSWFQQGGTLTIGPAMTTATIVEPLVQAAPVADLTGAILAKSGQAGSGERSDPALLASALSFVLEGLHLSGKLGKRLETTGSAAVFRRL
jgi:magnesium chelatase subunit I